MNLIIAEKPSVAQSLARELGATKRNEGFFEGNGHLVSWCIGHLITLAEAHDYDERYRKWQYADLPILPSPWITTVSNGKSKQFYVLKKLIHRSDIQEVCCATDAGREGELIFRLIYEKADGKKPVTRLWISSMEDEAILEGYRNRKPAQDFDDLYHAALCRAKADWLVGINASRLFSILYQTTLPVGRVQTPTLALLVDRETSIDRFVKTPYFLLHLGFEGFEAISERMDEKTEAESLGANLNGAEAVIQEIKIEDKTLQPPKLYDLTALQREANRLLGFAASETLELAQSLYEKKLITYPRTDSRYLTTDMAGNTSDILALVSLVLRHPIQFEPNINRLLRNDKVTDHHALISTMSLTDHGLKELSDKERTLLKLIALRLMQSTNTPHRYQMTTVTFMVGDEVFTSKGIVILDQGWKALDESSAKTEKQTEDDPIQELPQLQEGQALTVRNTNVTTHETAPPKPYTEDTLLATMEKAGKEDLADDVEPERQGLGTPATRAAIIEKLMASALIERKGKSIRPTQKGINLIVILPDKLTSASLTAEWENRLNRIARGKESPDDFLLGIENSVQELVSKYQAINQDEKLRFAGAKESIGVCPRCGSNVYESNKNYYCSSRNCAFVMWKNDLFFTKKKIVLSKELVAKLLTGETVWIDNLYSEKTDQTYKACISMQDTGEKHVRYKLQFSKEKQQEQEEPHGH